MPVSHHIHTPDPQHIHSTQIPPQHPKPGSEPHACDPDPQRELLLPNRIYPCFLTAAGKAPPEDFPYDFLKTGHTGGFWDSWMSPKGWTPFLSVPTWSHLPGQLLDASLAVPLAAVPVWLLP